MGRDIFGTIEVRPYPDSPNDWRAIVTDFGLYFWYVHRIHSELFGFAGGPQVYGEWCFKGCPDNASTETKEMLKDSVHVICITADEWLGIDWGKVDFKENIYQRFTLLLRLLKNYHGGDNVRVIFGSDY